MTYEETMIAAGRGYIRAVMEQSGGNAKRAAQMAGVNRTHFYKLLQKYQIPTTPNNYAHWRDLALHL